MEFLWGIAVLAGAITALSIYWSRRDRKRRALGLGRHRGSFRSQKGRAYGNAPSHNAYPSDGTG